MKVDDAFPGNWLKANDLGDEDHVVTIDSVKRERIGQGEQAKPQWVIKFHEFPKPMVCNVTNARAIAKVLGLNEMDDWKGQRITLWVNPDVSFGGETVAAIRVRNKRPGGGGTPSSNGVLTYQQAVQLVVDAGGSADDLKSHLKYCGVVGWNPATAAQCSQLARDYAAGIAGPPEFEDTESF